MKFSDGLQVTLTRISLCIFHFNGLLCMVLIAGHLVYYGADLFKTPIRIEFGMVLNDCIAPVVRRKLRLDFGKLITCVLIDLLWNYKSSLILII